MTIVVLGSSNGKQSCPSNGVAALLRETCCTVDNAGVNLEGDDGRFDIIDCFSKQREMTRN